MDIRVDVDFLDHPKTRALLDRAGNDGVAWILRLWTFTAKYYPKGRLSGLDADRIRHVMRNAYDTHQDSDHIEIMVNAGFLELRSGGVYCLHDWDYWQSWVFMSKERSVKARRAANTMWDKKKGRDASRNASRARNAMPLSSPLLSSPEEKISNNKATPLKTSLGSFEDWLSREENCSYLDGLSKMRKSPDENSPYLFGGVVAVQEEIARMKVWLGSHPDNIKKDWNRFVSNWLNNNRR